jgi:hypothetical protein
VEGRSLLLTGISRADEDNQSLALDVRFGKRRAPDAHGQQADPRVGAAIPGRCRPSARNRVG